MLLELNVWLKTVDSAYATDSPLSLWNTYTQATFHFIVRFSNVSECDKMRICCVLRNRFVLLVVSVGINYYCLIVLASISLI